jgi:hypothetical protein
LALITSNLSGHFKAATRRGPEVSGGTPVAEVRKLATAKRAYSGLSKHASYGGATSSSTGGSGADIRTTSPEIRNPLLNLINFYLPYDRKTLNQWIRYYARFDPYVGNCVDLHGEFPMSDFHFTGVSDKSVLEAYEEMKEETNMLQYCFEASREYELLGEVFSFWAWDEDELTWKSYTILNPDLLELKLLSWGSGAHAVYTYDPPQELKELVKDRDPRVLEQIQETMDPIVFDNIMANKRIPLDDFNMLSMVRRESPYESRGTSIIVRCLKDLMYKDKLREAQYAIAEQQITPVQLWKIGDPASGYMPTDEDLDQFRETIMAGRQDPLFTLVTHGAVNLDLIGYTGKLLNILPEMEWVSKQVLVAMFASDAMISGEGPTYSNAFVAFKVIQGRYQSKRDKFVQNFRNKLFKPFAKAREMWASTPAQLSHRIRSDKKVPLIPGIEWNFKLDLTDQTSRIQYLMQLNDKNKLAFKTLCEVLDIPYDVNKAALKEEEGTVLDSVYQSVRAARAEKTGMVPSMEETGGVSAPPGGGGGGPGGGDFDLSGFEPEPEVDSESEIQ